MPEILAVYKNQPSKICFLSDFRDDTVNFENIKSLKISGNIDSFLTFFERMTNLEEIFFNNSQISSLLFLCKCSKLSKITLISSYIKNLDELSICDFSIRLKKLSLCGNFLGNDDIEPLRGLQYCPNLRLLYLSQNNIRNLSGIEHCINLEHLVLDQNPINDESVEYLMNLNKLRTISFSGTLVTDYSFCSNKYNLESIEISQTPTKSLEPLILCPKLKYISCLDTQISKISIHPETNPLLECIYVSSPNFQTIPDYIIQFRHMNDISFENSIIQRSSVQIRRFIERILSTQESDNDMKVYGDTQNAHNSNIVKSIQDSLKTILEIPLEANINLDHIL